MSVPFPGSGVRVPSVQRRSALRRPSWVFLALAAVFLALCAAAWSVPLTRGDLAAPTAVQRGVALGVVLVGVVLSVTLHEWAHAAMAYLGGDASVDRRGYLTLDPRRYTNPMLSLVMPLVFLALGALPLPGGAVWIDEAALRSRGWRTAVSLAGSVMNLIVGKVCALAVASGALAGHPVLAGSLAYLALIQFAVAVLNLLPLPGLDGYAALEPWLPRSLTRAVDGIRQYALYIVLLLMLLGLFGFVWDAAFALLSLFGIPDALVGVGATLASLRGR